MAKQFAVTLRDDTQHLPMVIDEETHPFQVNDRGRAAEEESFEILHRQSALFLRNLLCSLSHSSSQPIELMKRDLGSFSARI